MAAPTLDASSAPAVPVPPGPRGSTGVRLLAVAGCASLVVVAALLSLRVGSVPLDTPTVLDALFAFDGSNDHLIVRTLRVPRTLVGLAVGVSLALAGVAMQAVTRNALASPSILGVNAGASFAVATAVFAFGVVSPAGYVWFAFAGAAAATVLVVLVASAGRLGATPLKLALAGAVVTALLQAWISAVLVLDERTLDEVRFWLAGSLVGRDVEILAQVLPFMAVGVLGVVLLVRPFDALGLGDDAAAGLGVRTGVVRASGMGVAVVLAGASVAVAGPVAFVGLAVPNAVRAVSGASHRWLVTYSALLGPVLLLSADVLGRVVARPGEVQVGIVTALVGAPVLIHLVRRRRSIEL
ncbi:iron ABC transporter permease [Nitriliruptoraceae bacterium ZYF776]|nr:iron ABC transporter permease [Profundirhabdus halotolerans]